MYATPSGTGKQFSKRAGDALERAKEQLRQKQSIQEHKMSQASLARALTRLKESSKYNA